MKRLILVALMLLCAQAFSQYKIWVYLPTYAYPTMNSSNLRLPGGTIDMMYMHFAAHISSTPPYFAPVTDAVSASSDSAQLHLHQSNWMSAIHGAGDKLLLSMTMQGSDGALMQSIANNPTQRKQFVSSVSSYCKRKGYDGVELDWESSLSATSTTALYKEFYDTLQTWSTPGLLAAGTLQDPFIYPGIWDWYNTTAMNTYLDAILPFQYVMNGSERGWSALDPLNGVVWRCMYDCPYTQPVGTPWSTFPQGNWGAYWATDLKFNGPTKWIANGASISKVGLGLWNGGTTMVNSNSSMVPGSPISYGTQGYVTYASILSSATSNYVSDVDHYWGIIGGLYVSWIDSLGWAKRVRWAKDTIGLTNYMVFDAWAGFVPTGSRQPHLDAMIAVLQGSAPSVTAPAVVSNPASNITSTGVAGNGAMTSDGGATISQKGFVWGTSSNPTTANNVVPVSGTTTGVFSISWAGLSPITTYHYRAFATNSQGTSYGANIQFTTLATVPTVTLTSIASITTTTATVNGNVTSSGGSTILSRGTTYATFINPTIANGTVIQSGSGTGAFASPLTGLTPATLYYARTWATNTIGTSYSADSTFTTSALPAPPQLITTTVSAITTTTATSGGNITFGTGVTARGVCWVVNGGNPPVVTDAHTTNGSGNGLFTSNLTGLSASVQYAVRAYATYSGGTVYGQVVTFQTSPPPDNDCSGNIFFAQGGTPVRMGDRFAINFQDGDTLTFEIISEDARIDSLVKWVEYAYRVAIPAQYEASKHGWKSDELMVGGVPTIRQPNISDANVLSYYNDPTKHIVQVLRVSATNNIVFFRNKQ